MKPVAAAPKPGTVIPVDDTTFVPEVLEADLPVLVDFMAQWCGPCRFMGPIFAEVAVEYADRVKFVKVDVDASPEVAGSLGITSIPTFALFRGKSAVAGMGAMPAADLRRWIEAALEQIAAAADTSAPAST